MKERVTALNKVGGKGLPEKRAGRRCQGAVCISWGSIPGRERSQCKCPEVARRPGRQEQ